MNIFLEAAKYGWISKIVFKSVWQSIIDGCIGDKYDACFGVTDCKLAIRVCCNTVILYGCKLIIPFLVQKLESILLMEDVTHNPNFRSKINDGSIIPIILCNDRCVLSSLHSIISC